MSKVEITSDWKKILWCFDADAFKKNRPESPLCRGANFAILVLRVWQKRSALSLASPDVAFNYQEIFMSVSKRVVIAIVSFSAILVAVNAAYFGFVGLASEVDQPATEGNSEGIPAWDGCLPENNSFGTEISAFEYAKMIEPELGVPPLVDCGASVEMPVYIDGVKTKGDPGLHECDNPSLQMGDCMSGSSLQRHEGVRADGTPLPHVVWVSFCRHDGRDDVFGWDVGDSTQMIGYNMETGATAFFESGDNKEWITIDPETNRMLGILPTVDDPDGFNKAFSTPGRTQCSQCHQADPFIHNPFIDGARLPSDPSQPVVPRFKGSDKMFDTPYYLIGGSDWDMRTIHIEGNKCLKCHRIGMKTVEEFIGDRWNPNEHMPPKNPGSLADSFQELVDCWEAGPEETPGCDWIIPAAGDCVGQVVGDDYPFKAGFNTPNLKNLKIQGDD